MAGWAFESCTRIAWALLGYTFRVTEGDDDWDFYPCQVDDAPASIFLNLRYRSSAPFGDTDTHYSLRIELIDKAEHGMGSAAEADALYPIEDEVIERAQALGFLYVGRLRTAGYWELTFYAPAESLDALAALAAGIAVRKAVAEARPDPDWDYYRDFLFPNDERREWMQDRRLVDKLQEQGDPLTTPRRVDHWLEFPTPEARNLFVADLAAEGFALESFSDPGGARVHRIDAVELETIHAAVVTLLGMAVRHGGTYDGWETVVMAQ